MVFFIAAFSKKHIPKAMSTDFKYSKYRNFPPITMYHVHTGLKQADSGSSICLLVFILDV